MLTHQQWYRSPGLLTSQHPEHKCTVKDGSITYYNIVNKGTATNPSYYCTIWNSSAGTMVAAPDGTGYWQYRPAGGQFGAAGTYFASATALNNAVHDGNNFYSANFSIPNVTGPVPSLENGTIQCIHKGQYMIIGTQGWQNETGVYKGWMMGVGLAPDNMGKKLWETTYTPPLALTSLNVSKPAAFTGGLGLTGVYPEDGVITWADPQTCQRWVYDLYSANCSGQAHLKTSMNTMASAKQSTTTCS